MTKLGLVCVALGLITQTVLVSRGPVYAGVSGSSSAPATGLSAAPRGVGGSAACPEATIAIAVLPAGQAGLELRSACRAEEEVQIRYAGLEFFRRLSKEGELKFVFDCIAGSDEPAQFIFLDGSTLQRTISTRDLDLVTKVAVVWRGAVNLDLHAFEYAAEFNQSGHVWTGAPSSLTEAQAAAVRPDGRIHGFLSLQADGRTKGDQLEVYTLWRGQAHAHGASGLTARNSGIITMALDYESREADVQDPETCGSGVFSEIAYDIIIREPTGATKRTSGAFAPLNCGSKLQKTGRYNTKAIPYIK
jgi:hypothetical protein